MGLLGIMSLERYSKSEFKTIEVLGRSSMSTAYLAKREDDGRVVVVKTTGKDSPYVDCLLHEASILRKAHHPSIPELLDIREDDGAYYLIIEYFKGISLEKYIRDRGTVSEATAAEWAVQICGVLSYLHSVRPDPIIYCDLKPSNILLSEDGGIKLIDFGASRLWTEERRHDTVYLGTKGFAAPEQYYGVPSTPATDIYSLGVTLHYLLTGESYGACNDFPSAIQAGAVFVREPGKAASPEFMNIICKCTRNAPGERYKTAAEAAAEIKTLTGRRSERTLEGYGALCASDAGDDEVAGGRIITVWGNTEFACEIAYVIAKYSDNKVLLADLDLFCPGAEFYLDVPHSPYDINGLRPVSGDSGLDFYTQAVSRGDCDPSSLELCCVKRNDLKNLHILTCSSKLENYEYFEDSAIKRLCDDACKVFDILIMSVGKFIYDSFTVLALLRSEINIIPLNSNYISVMEYCAYLSFLETKQKIPCSKARFVLYEYDAACHLDPFSVNDATDGKLAGIISYSKERVVSRNGKACFARNMDKRTVKEYMAILKKIGFKALSKEESACR